MTVEENNIPGLTGSDLRVLRENTAERAAGVLRNLIVRGEIAPGQPLRETQLAPTLGISRNTIREALRILAREALVAPSHRNVYTVVEISSDDVPDIFRARRMIEFASVAAIRADDSELDLGAMRDAVAELTKLPPEGAWWEVVDADLAFHTALVAQARSPRLSGMYKQLEGEIRLCLCVCSQFQLTLEELVEEHTELLTTLESRDYDLFERQLAVSMEDAAERVIGMLSGASGSNSTNGAAAA